MTRDMFDNLWGLENGYVDCTPKQYREWLLEHGTPIMVRGYARELQDKRIGPGVIRVSKVPLQGVCEHCHGTGRATPAADTAKPSPEWGID